jgi:hypothetical protein
MMAPMQGGARAAFMEPARARPRVAAAPASRAALLATALIDAAAAADAAVAAALAAEAAAIVPGARVRRRGFSRFAAAGTVVPDTGAHDGGVRPGEVLVTWDTSLVTQATMPRGALDVVEPAPAAVARLRRLMAAGDRVRRKRSGAYDPAAHVEGVLLGAVDDEGMVVANLAATDWYDAPRAVRVAAATLEVVPRGAAPRRATELAGFPAIGSRVQLLGTDPDLPVVGTVLAVLTVARGVRVHWDCGDESLRDFVTLDSLLCVAPPLLPRDAVVAARPPAVGDRVRGAAGTAYAASGAGTVVAERDGGAACVVDWDDPAELRAVTVWSVALQVLEPLAAANKAAVPRAAAAIVGLSVLRCDGARWLFLTHAARRARARAMLRVGGAAAVGVVRAARREAGQPPGAAFAQVEWPSGDAEWRLATTVMTRRGTPLSEVLAAHECPPPPSAALQDEEQEREQEQDGHQDDEHADRTQPGVYAAEDADGSSGSEGGASAGSGSGSGTEAAAQPLPPDSSWQALVGTRVVCHPAAKWAALDATTRRSVARAMAASAGTVAAVRVAPVRYADGGSVPVLQLLIRGGREPDAERWQPARFCLEASGRLLAEVLSDRG